MDDGRVRSSDGTELGVRVTGAGSPVVLVHGTTATKEAWVFAEPLLAEEHTVWAFDRCGRGESGDHSQYSLDAEVDDVLAVVRAAANDERVHLVGHSYGGCCALEAAARDTSLLATLILYEPPFHANRAARNVARALDQLEAGNTEGALKVFLRDVAGFSDEEVTMVRSVDVVWDTMEATVGTLPREAAALEEQGWDPTRYGSIDVPTLLISGELTAAPVYLTADELSEAVPAIDRVLLPGQRHMAIATDAAGFAEAVLNFIAQHSPRDHREAPL